MTGPSYHALSHQELGGADPIPDTRLIYVTPVAPATAPTDYRSGDALYPAFTGGWGNLSADYPPLTFRVLHGGIQILPGAITGGESSPGSVVFTIPAAYPRPSKSFRVFASVGADGSGIGVFELRPSGQFVFVNVVGTTGGGGVGGPGIFYDTANTGDWIQAETTGLNPAVIATTFSSYSDTGVAIVDEGGGGVLISANANGAVTIDGDNAINLDTPGTGSINIDTGEIFFNAHSGYSFNDSYVTFTTPGFEVDSTLGVSISETSASSNITVECSNGTIVFKTNGVSALKIRHDGTVHIKTGGTIHADL